MHISCSNSQVLGHIQLHIDITSDIIYYYLLHIQLHIDITLDVIYYYLLHIQLHIDITLDIVYYYLLHIQLHIDITLDIIKPQADNLSKLLYLSSKENKVCVISILNLNIKFY